MNSLSSIAQNIEVLSKEKKIDPQVIIGAIEDAVVTQPDVRATNGVVHIIDRVLIPPKR